MPGSAEPLLNPGVPVPHPVEPQPTRPRVWRWLTPLFGVLIAGGLAYWALAAKNTTPPPGAPVTVKTAVVKRGDLEVRVRINGQTSAQRYADIIAPKMRGNENFRDMVLLTIIRSGTPVHKGQQVAEFDPQNLKDHLDDTVAGYRDKENDVKQKKVQQELDMENLQQSLRVAKSTLDKAWLDNKALEVRTELDKEVLKLAVEEADATYKELQSEVDLTKQSQKADLRATDISRLLEEKHVDRDKYNLGRFVITAPMDGLAVVMTQMRSMGDQVPYEVGDRVYPGTTIIKVVDQKSMQLEATINQAESSTFKVGQEAEIRLDAYPDAKYPGKVYAIGALGVAPGRQQYYLRTIPIRLRIENPDNRLIPDLSGSADILLQREQNTLIVPASAVEYENGQAYVRVPAAQGYTRKPVTVGITSGPQTAIQSGLSEGDAVIVN